MYTPIVSKINGLLQSLGGAVDAKPLAALTPEFPNSSVCIRKERISFFLFSPHPEIDWYSGRKCFLARNLLTGLPKAALPEFSSLKFRQGGVKECRMPRGRDNP